MMQEMLSSTRSLTVFGLRSDEANDPNLGPLLLPVNGKSTKYDKTRPQNKDYLQSAEVIIPSPPKNHVYLIRSMHTQPSFHPKDFI
jgi:hypothetical protein